MNRLWLFRGQVAHTRLIPFRHAFNYPVFFLCFPLHRADELTGPLFSLDRFNLFGLSFKDHGARDGSNPATWARELLSKNGITTADGDIWMQTFPRVLGFVFNPVSFYYCHDQQGNLRAVICEVNNTFGERHLYLLQTPDSGWINSSTTLSCEKKFHVSPFFDVRGSYEFRFDLTKERRRVEINYQESETQTLRTSISGKAEPLCMKNLAKALISFGWQSIKVVIAIHWQALKLWRKGAVFHSKPHPPERELSR